MRRFNRYVGDPHWITCKFPGKCAKCSKPIAKGAEAFYYPRDKGMYGKACGCGDAAANDFRNCAEAEAYYGGTTGDYQPR
jgi:hypothetical protein